MSPQYRPQSRLQRVLAITLVVLVNLSIAGFIGVLADVNVTSEPMAAAQTVNLAHG